jgi:hypothetical protein
VFHSLFSRKEPLRGAPAAVRLKTYSAPTGFVYRYHYQGWRPYRSRGGNGSEFVFAVSAGPARSGHVSIFIEEAAVAAWENAQGRGLSATERYAIAKMAFFRAFDRAESPERMLRERVAVTDAEISEISAELDF